MLSTTFTSKTTLLKTSRLLTTAIVSALVIVLSPVVLRAQDPTAPAQGVPVKPYEQPSLSGVDNFTSLEGRFSISLPHQHGGFNQLVIQTPFGIARGDAYNWRLKEAAFIVGHADAPFLNESPETTQKIFESLHDQLTRLANSNSGNVRADKPIQLGKYPGVEQRVDLFAGSIIQRTYLVSRRLYQISAIVKTEQQEYESAATKALDTFKVLEESEVSEKLAEAAKKSEPDPLPQQPVAQRGGTDLNDDNLHGPVKTVLEESQDLTGTWSVQTRKRNSFVQYNEQGNRVRSESYDYKGNLNYITVYGYIDGKRVVALKMIQREYNPPPALVPGAATKKNDPRYQTSYEFTYDEKKRLIEKRWIRSNGDLSARDVYKYTGNQVERSAYSENGSLNQRSVTTLDAKGNEIERTSYDPRDNRPGQTYTYTYEFDSHGNWTKRTTSLQVTNKNGTTESEPQYVDFRTITYW